MRISFIYPTFIGWGRDRIKTDEIITGILLKETKKHFHVRIDSSTTGIYLKSKCKYICLKRKVAV